MVDRVEPFRDADFLYRIIGQEGIRFEPALELTFYPWFQELKRRLGNFSLGLTEVTRTYAQTLITFASSQYPSFLEVFTQVDLTTGLENIADNYSGNVR